MASEMSDMSFSVSRRDGGDNVRALRAARARRTRLPPARLSDAWRAALTPQCEWGSNGLGALFAQRSNAARPAFLRMLHEMSCFERDVLRRARAAGQRRRLRPRTAAHVPRRAAAPRPPHARLTPRPSARAQLPGHPGRGRARKRRRRRRRERPRRRIAAAAVLRR